MNVLDKLIADTLKQKNTQALEVRLRQPLNPHYLEIMLKALERRWFLEFFIHDHHIDPSNTLLVNHINRGIVNSPSHQEAE